LKKLARELAAARFSAILVLDMEQYQLFLIEAPKVQPDEMKTAIRWKIRDMIDYKIEEATIDALEMSDDPEQPFRERSIHAVVAKNEIIRERMDLFASAGIPLSVIDIPEMAQRNIAAGFEKEARGLALLSFGVKEVLLTITCQGKLHLSRHIDLPLSSLQERNEVLRKELFDKLTLELQRSIDHFERQYAFISLDRLMLGPSPGVEGLGEYLAQNLPLPVENIDLSTVIDFSSTPELLEPQWQARCWLSLGSALREEAS
ncbi:MAG TPA: agglutinin biogenesis protein MshI, partial [Burkholderiales bacterium]|nr:agglutinin biogenesis protein MshI [Burkholderiales bacterium]